MKIYPKNVGQITKIIVDYNVKFKKSAFLLKIVLRSPDYVVKPFHMFSYVIASTV